MDAHRPTDPSPVDPGPVDPRPVDPRPPSGHRPPAHRPVDPLPPATLPPDDRPAPGAATDTPSARRLTVVMPVYNEAATLRRAVERLLAVEMPLPTELVVVDDGSTDGGPDLIADLVDGERVRLLRQEPNQGKGRALARGVAEARGDLLTILDADLEYDPGDIPQLCGPVLRGEARVVYGARSYGGHAAYSFWFVMGNKLVAYWASFLFDAWITDVETCCKLAPRDTWRDLDVSSSGFGVEAEVTGKLLARGERIFEVPISYRARGREEGKKIQWTDGVEALWILLRIRVRAGRRRRAGRS